MPGDLQPVTFRNTSGHLLFGMLHRPTVNHAPGVAVLLLSPGIKGRNAPHRLYVKLARRLCEAGFMVLRFDFYGLGDAEGELDETLVADVYAAVSVGRYVGDTVAAMDWLQREHQIERFVLSGLCGGAITGLFSGAQDRRVEALVGFGIPVIQYGNDTMRYRFLSAGEKGRFRRGYILKLMDWRSWVRLLTFRSDFSVIAKVFLSPLKRVWQSKNIIQTQSSPTSVATSNADDGNLNSFFPPAFFKMLTANRKMLLIFGETDRLYWDFDEKFYQPRKQELDQYHGLFEIYLVKDARHVFEERGQQEDLLRTVVHWIQREYEVGPERTAG